MIVDTHIHVTSRDHATYPIEREWIPRRLERLLLTGEDLIALMDEAGVDRAVLVQATNTHGYDNAYAADMARAYPDASPPSAASTSPSPTPSSA